jgi:hypothetical protein
MHGFQAVSITKNACWLFQTREEQHDFICSTFLWMLKNKMVSLLVLQNKQKSKTAAAESDDDGRSTFYDFRRQIFMGTHKGH